MKFSIPLLLLTCAVTSLAQSTLSSSPTGGTEDSSPPRKLILGRTTPLGMPSFGSLSISLCDIKNNLYFETINSGVPAINQGRFIRVSDDGKQQVLYLPPTTQNGTPRFQAVFQAVSPDGSHYLLGRNEKESVLIRYRDDGSISSEHRLPLPEKAYPQMVAVANSGAVYVSGYVESGPSDKWKKSFAGLYADDGTLLADLSKGLKDFDASSLSRAPEGAVIAGQDGLFYNLQSNHVTVFSQSGKLQRTIAFRKPDATWSAIRLDVSGSLASIQLVAPDLQPSGLTLLSSRLLLLDMQTGETRGTYVFDPGAPSSVLCFSRQDGFSVYGVKDGQAVRNWYTVQ